MMLLFALAAVHLTPLDSRVENVLRQMTLREKIDYIGGSDGFNIRAIPRLGVLELRMSDGPLGIRNYGPAPAYSGGLAATFDVDLAHRFGEALGNDARARNVDIWLGPGVNLARIPQCGRNWEYYGEDPYLAGMMAANSIQGAQSRGIAATVKHYAANNHESDRNNDSSEVDERTLRELYLRTFEYAIRIGKPHFVMSGYNLVNGVHASENEFLLNTVLRKEWGFAGAVMSDWVSVYSTLGPVNHGLDLEMPGADYMNAKKIEPLIASGEIKVSTIDEKVRRLLAINFAVKDRQKAVPAPTKADSNRNADLSYEMTAKAAVLLKNDGILPLSRERTKKILVVGAGVKDQYANHGGGSGYTVPVKPQSLVEGIRKAAGSNVEVVTLPDTDVSVPSRGPSSFKASFYRGMDLKDLVTTATVSEVGGNWKLGRPSQLVQNDNFSIRYEGTFRVDETQTFLLTSGSDDGMRVFIDGKLVVDEWNDRAYAASAKEITLEGGQEHTMKVEYFERAGEARLSCKLVAKADYEKRFIPQFDVSRFDAIVVQAGFGPDREGEGFDRPFDLSNDDRMIIEAMKKTGRPVVVVLSSGGAVEVASWLDGVGALLEGWYPGDRGNEALAGILFGDINPTGRLACTFPKALKGTYYDDAYPSKDRKLVYKEGLFMGYRWFDKNQAEPLFPFGFGLSYVRPELKSAKRAGNSVKVKLTNSKRAPSEEVVQVYASLRTPGVEQVVRKLVGFRRIGVGAGQTVEATVSLDPEFLSYWDPTTKKWTAAKNADLWVGTSSRDLPIKLTIGR